MYITHDSLPTTHTILQPRLAPLRCNPVVRVPRLLCSELCVPYVPQNMLLTHIAVPMDATARLKALRARFPQLKLQREPAKVRLYCC